MLVLKTAHVCIREDQNHWEICQLSAHTIIRYYHRDNSYAIWEIAPNLQCYPWDNNIGMQYYILLTTSFLMKCYTYCTTISVWVICMLSHSGWISRMYPYFCSAIRSVSKRQHQSSNGIKYSIATQWNINGSYHVTIILFTSNGESQSSKNSRCHSEHRQSSWLLISIIDIHDQCAARYLASIAAEIHDGVSK